MKSSMKTMLQFLPFGLILLIVTIYYLPSNLDETENAEKNIVENQISRSPRAVKPVIRSCKLNQYYDEEEGRCLGVPGGGKVLHIDNGRSCGINVLKPHCTSAFYYYICKRDKSILAQCANNQLFSNRLQRCVHSDPTSDLSPSIVQSDKYDENRDHVQPPVCTRPGRFPVPGHCATFYVCDTNGHRLVQSVFRCPQNTGYQADRAICAVAPDCENDDSVRSTICVPNAPDEAVESRNIDVVAEEDAGSTLGSPDESNVTNNPDIAQFYSTTEASTREFDALDPSEATKTETLTPDQKRSGPIESASDVLEETQNKQDESTSPLLNPLTPSTAELDDASHSITSVTSKPDYNANTDINSNVDSESADVAAFPSIDDASPKVEETRDVTAQQNYKNDNDDIVIPPSVNEPNQSPSVDLSETTSELSNRDTETSVTSPADTILSPDVASDGDHHTVEESEVPPAVGETINPDLHTDGVESVSTQYSPEGINNSDLTMPTTTTLIPIAEDLPGVTGNTDSVTQNGEDNVEALIPSTTE